MRSDAPGCAALGTFILLVRGPGIAAWKTAASLRETRKPLRMALPLGPESRPGRSAQHGLPGALEV
jgi:hypothetical protein